MRILASPRKVTCDADCSHFGVCNWNFFLGIDALSGMEEQRRLENVQNNEQTNVDECNSSLLQPNPISKIGILFRLDSDYH